MVPFFYALNILLLLSGLLAVRLRVGERRFSLALVQTLFALPLLALEYFYLAHHLEVEVINLILFSENVFVLIWLGMTLHLHRATTESQFNSIVYSILEISLVVAVVSVTSLYLAFHFPVVVSIDDFAFRIYGFVYLSALSMLIIVVYGTWRLEQFWRRLSGAMVREYKFLLVGSLLVSGSLAWSSSYRLSYMFVLQKHLILLAIILLLSWLLMVYAVLHHRLLNRKIFVSRKVIYSFVIPSLLATYMLGFGLVLVIMQTFGLEMSFVLTWVVVVLGLVAIGIFAFSKRMRRRVHFFISTHFYLSKYEYRDKWLAFSRELQGAVSETDVVKALYDMLVESLFTSDIYIWLGDSDSSKEYRLVSSFKKPGTGEYDKANTFTDIPVDSLTDLTYFHIDNDELNAEWQKAVLTKGSGLTDFNIALLAPISTGNQLVGIIGLGPEFTGGQYGQDDFDLLTALGCQTASALLAVRTGEELANVREQQAWSRLSAFVLHDIKNAATMLSLLQENAPGHIHEPEFQKDMLELVDDALVRMKRVEQRLGTLREEVEPKFQHMKLETFLKQFSHRMKTKLSSMKIKIISNGDIKIRCDPELLGSILENLVINAYEAQGKKPFVLIKYGKVANGKQALIEIEDNGQGIAPELLPDLLFEPFKTSKEGGSGIGLWQVKRLVVALQGNIIAENNPHGGGRFVIWLPLPGFVL